MSIEGGDRAVVVSMSKSGARECEGVRCESDCAQADESERERGTLSGKVDREGA